MIRFLKFFVPVSIGYFLYWMTLPIVQNHPEIDNFALKQIADFFSRLR